VDNRSDKTIELLCEGLHADAFLVMMTLSQTPRPLYPRKAETISFLHVLLVWGVKLTSSLTKMCQSLGCVLKQTVDRIRGLAGKEIFHPYYLTLSVLSYFICLKYFSEIKPSSVILSTSPCASTSLSIIRITTIPSKLAHRTEKMARTS